jgi:hypothetical protein
MSPGWIQPSLSTQQITSYAIFTENPFPLESCRRIRLLERNSASQLSLTKDLIGDDIPKYAILLHTWGVDTEEVTFKDMIDGTSEDKSGYKKIRFCAQQATDDGL